jgi:threonine dehydrogenase-like Zn-dependent dehydrogenase
VVAPFVWADNTCDFCRESLQTSCRHGGGWGAPDVDGGQGEAVRVPQAQGTLVKLPVGEDSALLPSPPRWCRWSMLAVAVPRKILTTGKAHRAAMKFARHLCDVPGHRAQVSRGIIHGLAWV